MTRFEVKAGVHTPLLSEEVPSAGFHVRYVIELKCSSFGEMPCLGTGKLGALSRLYQISWESALSISGCPCSCAGSGYHRPTRFRSSCSLRESDCESPQTARPPPRHIHHRSAIRIRTAFIRWTRIKHEENATHRAPVWLLTRKKMQTSKDTNDACSRSRVLRPR